MGPGELSLPPVSSSNKTSAKSGVKGLKVASDSGEQNSSRKQAIVSLRYSSRNTVSTEVINLRSNWSKGTTKTNRSCNQKKNDLTLQISKE